MAWETREGPNHRWRVDGAPLPHRRLVNQGSRHGQPPAWGRAWGPRGTGRDGTAYGEVQAEPARFAMALRAWAAGHARRRTARLGPMDQERAGDWWARAAQPGRKVLRSRGQDVPGRAGHREAWGRGVPPQAAPLALATRGCDTSGEAWRGRALAPGWRLVRALVVGTRPQERAHRWRPRVAPVPAPRRPWCTSDQGPESRPALRHGEGPWGPPARPGTRGPVPEPRRVPPPDVRSAPGVHHRRRGPGGGVTPTAMVGKPPARAVRRAAPPPAHPSTPALWRESP
jgi:hypothetical protein